MATLLTAAGARQSSAERFFRQKNKKFFVTNELEDRFLEKQKNYLSAALKVFRALADNLNNGGLLTAPAGKTNVTAS